MIKTYELGKTRTTELRYCIQIDGQQARINVTAGTVTIFGNWMPLLQAEDVMHSFGLELRLNYPMDKQYDFIIPE